MSVCTAKERSPVLLAWHQLPSDGMVAGTAQQSPQAIFLTGATPCWDPACCAGLGAGDPHMG